MAKSTGGVRLLLHTCCGPCFLGVWSELSTRTDVETTIYYDNSNIYPEAEWQKRRDNLRRVAAKKRLDLIEADYDSQVYDCKVASFTSELPGRCLYCYRMRLKKVAQFARDNGYSAISTTLFVSPYQQHDELKKVAAEVAEHYGVDFYYTDWRPYFRQGQNEARDAGIYRQRYCGCRLSLAESGVESS